MRLLGQIILASLIFTQHAIAETGQGSPEEALACYIDGFNRNDISRINACSDYDLKDLKNDDPIETYEILEKRISSIGKTELIVDQKYKGRTHTVTYTFEKRGDRWLLIHHESWDLP